jgi:phage baseplate assembly protein gpV
VNDFVRSPGDSVPTTMDSNPSNLIGRVISVTVEGGTSTPKAEKKRHCTVQFPDGREATYDDKNLEIVSIDGTGKYNYNKQLHGEVDIQTYVFIS